MWGDSPEAETAWGEVFPAAEVVSILIHDNNQKNFPGQVDRVRVFLVKLGIANYGAPMNPTAPFLLSQAQTGARLRILSFSQDSQWHTRLSDLGLHPGSIIEVMKATGPSSPMVVKRGAGRIMVDALLKHEILVEEWREE
jgi:Fe2+ transport system protein FeoA